MAMVDDHHGAAHILAVSGNRELVEELGDIFWRDKCSLWQQPTKEGSARSIDLVSLDFKSKTKGLLPTVNKANDAWMGPLERTIAARRAQQRNNASTQRAAPPKTTPSPISTSRAAATAKAQFQLGAGLRLQGSPHPVSPSWLGRGAGADAHSNRTLHRRRSNGGSIFTYRPARAAAPTTQ